MFKNEGKMPCRIGRKEERERETERKNVDALQRRILRMKRKDREKKSCT